MKKIFVGNLDFGVVEESIRELFEKVGAVEAVDLVRDRDTGQPREFAFVEMTGGGEADRAISELNGAPLLGSRTVNVNEARPKAAAGSPGGFRHQGGGPPRQRREPRW
jgi:cold-inducible RNA-binding protein